MLVQLSDQLYIIHHMQRGLAQIGHYIPSLEDPRSQEQCFSVENSTERKWCPQCPLFVSCKYEHVRSFIYYASIAHLYCSVVICEELPKMASVAATHTCTAGGVWHTPFKNSACVPLPMNTYSWGGRAPRIGVNCRLTCSGSNENFAFQMLCTGAAIVQGSKSRLMLYFSQERCDQLPHGSYRPLSGM